MAIERKMQRTILGFVPFESPIYGIHPLVRFVIFIVTGLIPLFVEMPEVNFLFLLGVFALFAYSRVSFRTLKVYLPMIFTVGFFLLLTYTFFPIAKGEKILLFQIGSLNIYYSSLIWAVCVYFRIIALIYASVFYFSTNRERDILIAFRYLGTPFVAAYFLSLSLRAAGMFMEDYKIVREAEQARGLDTDDLSFIGKVKHFSMYMVPLFTLAIRRSEEISIGLYAKGTTLANKINGKKRPDYLIFKNPVRSGDLVLISGILVVFAGLLVFQLTTGAFNLEHSPLNVYMLKMLKGGS